METDHGKQIEKLYLELYDKMIIYAGCTLCSRPLAEEAVQEAFRVACQKPQSVCTSSNPQGWIFNTLKHTIQNIRSDQASTKKLLEQYIVIYGAELTSAPDPLSIDSMYTDIADSEEFQILKELAIENRSHEEMAVKRNISVNACKKRVQRAKEKLQIKLKNCLL